MNKKIDSAPILIDSYNYSLPDERIAKYPLEQRDKSKLLIYRNHEISEDIFLNAASYVPEKSLLVYNNTKVIQARLVFRKPSGARIEVFCLEPVTPSDYALIFSTTRTCTWKCMVGNLKKWKSGTLEKQITTGKSDCTLKVTLLSSESNTHHVRFDWDNEAITFSEILESGGELPIPPYLHRETEESDKTTYQTVYSKIKGSVAAPTAGLHFTEEVFSSMKKKSIGICELTLHVGAGTFQPVKTSDIADHTMHTEVISVHKDSLRQIMENEGKIIAVGTTSVRTLESLYYIGLKIYKQKFLPGDNIHVSQWEPYQTEEEIPTATSLNAILDFLQNNNMNVLHAETQILIRPGFRFRIIQGMFTNFHQPKSTLLLLVSAFTGERWKSIYDYAMQHDFRFLSYGDSSLLLK